MCEIRVLYDFRLNFSTSFSNCDFSSSNNATKEENFHKYLNLTGAQFWTYLFCY